MSSYFMSCLKPTGTNSFRLSATKLYNGMGGNSQNNDRSSLSMFVAHEGRSIVQRDQSGAEAYVVANLCSPGAYRDLFIYGVKPHTYLALNLFGQYFPEFDHKLLKGLMAKELVAHPQWPPAKKVIEKAPIWYDLAKRICHAATYKMGAKTFQMNVLKESFGQVRLTYDEAKTYLASFFELYPEITEWQESVVREVKAKRVLTNLLGSPRVFGRNMDESYEREIISWIPQSTVGEITHECVAHTVKHIKTYKMRWSLISNKHDSAATEVPDPDVRECVEIMGKGMAVIMHGKDNVEFTMRCDAQVGKNFGKYHATNNPLGMKAYDFV